MTNKNKKNRTQEAKAAQEDKRKAFEEKKAASQAKAPGSVTDVDPSEKQNFTLSQFNVILLLGVGCMKLMNMSSAIRKGDEPTKLCKDYFVDDDICLDDSVNTFLRFKLMLSVQVMITVLAVALQCWRSEDVLARYTGTLLGCPVMITGLVLASNNRVIDQRTAWFRDIIMAFILTLFTMPPKENMPFLTGKKQANNTLQSLVIMIFCCFCFGDLVNWGSTIVNDGAKGLAETLFTPAYLATLSEEASPGLTSVATFFLVDKISMAISIFFSWFYLKEVHHRVSTTTVVANTLWQYCRLSTTFVVTAAPTHSYIVP